MAVATMGGACLARWRPGRQELWFGAAAGALLVIAGFHLLPDAWADARSAGLWPGTVVAAAVISFTVAGAAGRLGCSCEEDQHRLNGTGAAAALAAHRFLEGSALALAGSVTVAAALAAHALGEGLAVGALLAARPRRTLAPWLAVMCLGPLAGAVITSAWPLPAAAGPVLLGVAAGILAQAAQISLGVAFRRLDRVAAVLASPSAAALAASAAVTAVAVHFVG